MPTTASEAINGRASRATDGNSGTAYRQKPKVPIFSITPARIIDPATGAWTCASGSQVWTGNMGTLIANARAKAPTTHGPYVWSACASGEIAPQPFALAEQVPTSRSAGTSAL